MTKVLQISTPAKTALIDITGHVTKVVKTTGVTDGICVVYVPHTTASVTINENADPSVKADIIDSLDKLIPAKARYTHLEGNSPAHIKASLVGSSATLLIKDNSLLLGTWQGIYFCEFDGPRRREVFVKVINEK